VAEQTPQTGPITAQSTAIAPAMASICNAEWACLRGMSGHVRLPLRLSVLASPVSLNYWLLGEAHFRIRHKL
jgi:hypothetical protein